MAFPFNLNQQRKHLNFYDIRKDLLGFESMKDAEKESQIRQQALINGGNHDLAEKLANCAKGDRCCSPACPQCVRINRRGFFHAAAVLAKQYKGGKCKL